MEVFQLNGVLSGKLPNSSDCSCFAKTPSVQQTLKKIKKIVNRKDVKGTWVSVTTGLGTACPTGNTLSQAFQTTSVSQGFTSKQNFCELEILGSRENQGRKKSILIKFPIPACWQARGTFPSLPGLPPQPWPQAGTAPLGKMCPGGSEAQPCSAWHTALPHPPGREGKSMDMGTI